MGGQINTATGKWRSEAERQRAKRERTKQRDPDYLARERARIAAVRAQQRREQATATFLTDGDERTARRRQEREARRAARRAGVDR